MNNKSRLLNIYNEGFQIVMYSESLKSFSGLFKERSNLFTITGKEIEDANIVKYTLQPIVLEVSNSNNLITCVFDEIFGILPILIVVLIGFISLKKGISYLFSLLKKT